MKKHNMMICLVFISFICLSLPVFSQSENVEQPKAGKVTLEVWFRLTSTPMTERDIYYHVCRLYVDDKQIGESPAVNKETKWVRIFSVELEEGDYNFKVLHGYASKEGKWAGEFVKQPKVFSVRLKSGPPVVIRYSYNVGLLTDDYVYDKLPLPPPPAPPKIPPKNKPRMMVVIPEKNFDRYIPDPAAETAVIKKFVENDFLVVDQAQIEKIRYNDESKMALGNNEAAIAIGRQFNTEVLIIGESFSQILGSTSSGLIRCTARVEARVIRVDTGQILATRGVAATAEGTSEEIASKKALAEAGSEIGDYLMREIARKWSSERSPSVKIKLSNVDFRQLVLFEQMLGEKVEGVQSFIRRNFDVAGKVAEIDVDVVGGAQPLSTGFVTKQFPDFEVEVLNFTSNTLDLRLKPKEITPKESIPTDLILRPKMVVSIEQTTLDGKDRITTKVMVIKADEKNLEYGWAIETPGGSSYSGVYSIDAFDKSHEYEAEWEVKGKEPPKGTYPWVSTEVFRELKDNKFTNIVIDKSSRKDTIVVAELKGATVFPVDINGKKTEVKAIEVKTDKGDKLLILDEPRNPLVLSAEVISRYKSRVTTIFIPGYQTQNKTEVK